MGFIRWTRNFCRTVGGVALAIAGVWLATLGIAASVMSISDNRDAIAERPAAAVTLRGAYQ